MKIDSPCHTMKMVTRRTGLSSHVIRIWEKRYGAVKPLRTPTNRRLYREQDIDRLLLLHQATQAGHSIGQVATLPEDSLRHLVAKEEQRINPPPSLTHSLNAEAAGTLLNPCLQAVIALDTRTLDRLLDQAAVQLGYQGLLSRLAAPLSQKTGDLWRSGDITAAHEHFLSAALRNFLTRQSRQFAPPPSSPALIVATPAGQLHELGAILAAAAAANLGWKTIYLGTSLPAAEIAGAALQQSARAVALSLVYPEDDPLLPDELRRLRGHLPPTITLIVGGRASRAYQAILDEIGARVMNSLEDLYSGLETLRTPPAKHGS